MNDLYQKLLNKQEALSLVGLGYVGMPIAVAFANEGIHVIGFDLNKGKIDLYKSGIDPTHEVGDEAIKTTVFGYYTHCDIAEVLCSTGLIGGLLYISIYILSFRKLYVILRHYRENNISLYKQTGILLAGLVTIVFIGFGNVSFESLSHWLLLSAIIAFTQLNYKQGHSKKNTGRLTVRGTRYL